MHKRDGAYFSIALLAMHWVKIHLCLYEHNEISGIKQVALPLLGLTSLRSLATALLPTWQQLYPAHARCSKCIYTLPWITAFITLVAYPLGLQLYSIDSIKDLITLKSRNANAAVHHADITPYLRQNCDATVRVISATTIEQLSVYVPESEATQLYLQAALWTHEPFRNRSFGSPPQVVKVAGNQN